MKICDPPVIEQLAIVKRTMPLFDIADSIEERLREVTAQVNDIRRAILSTILRGELTTSLKDKSDVSVRSTR